MNLRTSALSWTKKIQLQLEADSEEITQPALDEQIQALRAAHQHYSQPRQFQEKANSLQELLNLQSLHTQVTIMRALFTTLQSEIDKLLENVNQQVKKSIYFSF